MNVNFQSIFNHGFLHNGTPLNEMKNRKRRKSTLT